MTVTDAALIVRTRNGDMGAYDELYRRHVDGATRVARIVVGNDEDAQDLVSEAFTRVLRRLQDGGGPDDDLAPYLRTVVRRLAVDHYRSAQRSGSADPGTFDAMPSADDPIAKATDRQLVRRAFEGLPARWQEVLWHTEIEGRSPAWLAERLGTSANSVAALAYRAREGLRQTYMSLNVVGQVRPECRAFARRIPAQVRGTLTAGENDSLAEHLAQCAQCRERRDELQVLVSDLPAALWPALLLPVAGPNIAAGAAATGAGGGLFAWLSPSNWSQNAGRAIGVSTTVVAAAAIAVAALLVANQAPEGRPDAGPPPATGSEQRLPAPVAATESPEEDPSPPVDEEPQPSPDDSNESPQDEPVASPDDPEQPPPDATRAPAFAVHPRSVTVRAGEAAILSTVVTGTPAPELQWQIHDRESRRWQDVPDADRPELELEDPTPDFDGREYRVVATNGSGSATSDVAEVTVQHEPVVVTEPDDVDVDFGDELALRATADANPTVDSAHWQVRDGDGWSNVPGSRTSGSTAELVLEGVDFDDEAAYRAAFANEIGTTVSGSSTVAVGASGALQVEIPGFGDPDRSNVRCARPSGERVRLSECTDSTWRLSADGALRWADGTCLEVADLGGFLRHATTARCTGADTQRWTIDPADAGPQRLANRDGACLAVYGWYRVNILAAHPCDSPWSRRFVFALDAG